MNRIYKHVWNRARNMYMVVSEIAKGHTKAKSNTARKGITALLLLSLLSGNMVSVYAQTSENKVIEKQEENKSGKEDKKKNENKAKEKLLKSNKEKNTNTYKRTALARSAKRSGPGGSALGSAQRKLDVIENGGAIEIGDGARSSGDGGVVIGSKSYIGKEGVAIGSAASALLNGIAIGNQANVHGNSNIAIGREASVKSNFVNDEEHSKSDYIQKLNHSSIAIGYGAKVDLREAELDYKYSDGAGIAIGAGSKVLSAGAMAIGRGAEINKNSWGSVAMGTSTSIDENVKDSVAIGYRARVTTGTIVKNEIRNAVAIGSDSVASRDNEFSIGDSSIKRFISNVADGKNDDHAATVGQLKRADQIDVDAWKKKLGVTNAGGNDYVNINPSNPSKKIAAKARKGSVAVGAGTNADSNSVAVGDGANASKDMSTAVGEKASATNYGAVAIGKKSVSSGKFSTAVGSDANAANLYSAAFGKSANATAIGATAVGRAALAKGERSVALGTESEASEENEVSLGKDEYKDPADPGKNTSAIRRFISHVADGKKDDHAATVGQLKRADQIDVDAWKKKLGVTNAGGNKYVNIAPSDDIDAEATKNSVAIGAVAKAKNNSVAVGDNADGRENSVSIGSYSSAIGKRSVTIGDSSAAVGTGSIVIGSGSAVHMSNSIAVGEGAVALSQNSIIIGSKTRAEGLGAVVLGNESKALKRNSVALGNKSEALEEDEVSIGNSSTKRFISNVADGKKDDHAATVGQLKRADQIDASAWQTKLGMDKKADKAQVTTDIANAVKDKATKTELTNAVKDKADKSELTNKANVNADNVDASAWQKKLGFDKKADKSELANYAKHDGSNVTAPATWAEKLGTGKVVKDNKELVTGGTVFAELDKKADRSELKGLVKGAVAIADGTNTTVTSETDTAGKTTYKVNVDGSKIDLSKNTTITKVVNENVTKNITNEITKTDGVIKKELANYAKKNAENIDVSAWQTKLGMDKKADKAQVATDIANAVKDRATKTELTNAVKDKADKSEFVNYAKHDGSNVTAPITWAEKLGTGKVVKDNKELVTGGTVYEALEPVKKNVSDNKNDISAINKSIDEIKKSVGGANPNTNVLQKANLDADNLNKTHIEKWQKKLGIDQKADVNAGNIEVKKWSQKLGTGKVAKDDGNLVTGKTVYEEFNKRDLNFQNKIDNIQNTVTTNVTNAVTKNVGNAYGMNIYTGSSMDASTKEFHSEKDWKMKLGELNMAFGGGIQAEQLTDKNGKRYTYVSLENKSKPGGGTTPTPGGGTKPNPGGGTTPTPGGGTTPTPGGGTKPNPGGGTTPTPGGGTKPNPGGGTTPTPGGGTKPNPGGGTNPSKPVDFSGVYNKMNKGFAVMNAKVNRVGAGAAALAALHPLEYDPENKFDFAVGYGNYQGANAVALGAHYRPNENTMLSLGGSFGGGENMINAGMSWRLGQGTSSPLMSKRALIQEIQKLGKVDEIFVEKIKEQDNLISLESITRQREDDKINQRIDELESQVQDNNARITELEAVVRNSRR